MQTILTTDMRFNMCNNSIDIIELFLAEWAGEILRGMYSRVVDQLVLCRETVLTLFAPILVALTERTAASTYCFTMF